MIKANKKLIITISALVVFAFLIFAGYCIIKKPAFLSGFREPTSQEMLTCLEGNKISQNQKDCLFISCNGFF